MLSLLLLVVVAVAIAEAGVVVGVPEEGSTVPSLANLKPCLSISCTHL